MGRIRRGTKRQLFKLPQASLAKLAPLPPSEGRLGRRLGSVIYCGSLFAVAIAVGLAIQRVLGVQNVLLVFLPVILVAAVRYGFWTASWVSVLSVLATSFLFAEPRYSFAVSDPGNVWALAVFLIAAGLTSSVASQARQRAEAVGYYNRILEHLYAFASRLAGLSGRRELVAEIARQADDLLGADVALLERDRSAGLDMLKVAARSPAAVELTAADIAAARACVKRAEPTSAALDEDPGAGWRFRPIKIKERAVAALGTRVRTAEKKRSQLSERFVDLLIEQIEVNLERTELAEQMRHAEMLAETEKLRGALLTSISHDFRTPLSSILGNVTSLRRYGHLYDDETRDEMLDQAEVATLRLSRFVDNLLQMTRLESGALTPTRELIDLDEVIGSALKRLERTLAGHVVRVDVGESVPMLTLDFVLTEQVIVNLLDNAAKYAPPGTVIDIAVAAAPGSVLLTISDEGPGIAREDIERVFERFFRIETPDRRPAGVGLGLAICKGFAEAMGATVSVANRASGRGAMFRLVFPVDGVGPAVS